MHRVQAAQLQPDEELRMRDIIALACIEVCRSAGTYSTTKNKKKTTERLEIQQVLPLLPEAHGSQGDEVGQ